MKFIRKKEIFKWCSISIDGILVWIIWRKSIFPFLKIADEEELISLGGASFDDYITSDPSHSSINRNEFPKVESITKKSKLPAQTQTAYEESF